MVLIIELLISPEKTLNKDETSSRLNLYVAFIGVLVMTALDFIFMFEIGNVEGGNPCLWFIIGGLLDLEFIETLPLFSKWLLLYPIKIGGDIALIVIPGLIAKRFYGGTKEQMQYWAKAYCYYLTILDCFLVISMLPAVIGGASGRYLLITNLLSFLVFSANILLIGIAYKCCFSIDLDKTVRGWFIPIVIGMITISIILVFLP